MTKIGTIANQREALGKVGRIRKITIDMDGRVDLRYECGNHVTRSTTDPHRIIALLDKAKQDIIEGYCK